MEDRLANLVAVSTLLREITLTVALGIASRVHTDRARIPVSDLLTKQGLSLTAD